LAIHALFSSVTMCADPSSEASHPTLSMDVRCSLVLSLSSLRQN